jgi:Helix-turn-helix domain
MEIYTLKEASRKAKIGIETLKRACEEGLIKATRLANGQWRIAESALSEALHHGLDLRNLSKRLKKKRPQPEGLRRAQEKKKAAKRAA